MRVPTGVQKVWSRVAALRPNRLRVEVRAHLPILPVLRGQLAETARQVEEAVVKVCDSFLGMTARARQAVAEASLLLHGTNTGSGDDGEASSMESLIDRSHTTILHLLERMERNSELSVQAARKMEEVRDAMRRMVASVTEVDQIAFANKLLALNAKIEAVHVGELGEGFGVVADAISYQAQKSTQLTEKIQETIRAVSSAAQTAAGELHETAAADAAMLAASRREAEATLAGLHHTHERIQTSLSAMTAQSTDLADEISRAILSLQFQDRVNQRISHVVDALESMEAALSRPLGTGDDDHHHGRHRQVAEDLRSSYTMQAEREVECAPTGAGDAGHDGEDGAVELF